MAVEICFLFGKTIVLLLSDRVSAVSFAGFGYFFVNRELFPIVRLLIYILLHFTFEFLGGTIPTQKFAQMPHLRVIQGDQTALFLEPS